MKWCEETKEKISYTVAVLALLFGMGLTVAGFLVSPLGVVDDSVLWILGQTLLYSGSVFGIGLYINGKTREIKNEIIDHFKAKDFGG